MEINIRELLLISRNLDMALIGTIKQEKFIKDNGLRICGMEKARIRLETRLKLPEPGKWVLFTVIPPLFIKMVISFKETLEMAKRQVEALSITPMVLFSKVNFNMIIQTVLEK